MKSIRLLALAWLLILSGFALILGGPAVVLYRHHPVAFAGLIGADTVEHEPTTSELAFSSWPFITVGICLVFAGVFLRQRYVVHYEHTTA
jgi:hypothetical protein